MTTTHVPLVCNKSLHDLEVSLFGEEQLCRNFVSRYIEMWPDRFARLHDAVTSHDHEKAMDAALSLRSSSIMVGAARLGCLATDLIVLLESGQHTATAKNLATLHLCGAQTMSQLTASYIEVA